MFHELQKKQEEELYKDRGEPYFNDMKSKNTLSFGYTYKFCSIFFFFNKYVVFLQTRNQRVNRLNIRISIIKIKKSEHLKLQNSFGKQGYC